MKYEIEPPRPSFRAQIRERRRPRQPKRRKTWWQRLLGWIAT